MPRGVRTGQPSQAVDAIRPPVRRREFWLTQVMVVFVAVLHGWVESLHMLDEHSPVYLVPTTLYLIPVAYAAVTFGAYGALATGAFAALLTLPNLLLWHPGLSSVGEIAQVGWIVLAGVFVGVRVDRERDARAEAERSRDRVRALGDRYLSILENIVEPIILLDHDRRVLSANRAAARLESLSVDAFIGRELTGPTGSTILRALPDLEPGGEPTRLPLGPEDRWYDIHALETEVAGHGRGLQLLLIDVTAEQERMTRLEELTRGTLAAREEERLRIARDIHDGPLQSVIAIHRALDVMAERPSEAVEALPRALALAQGAAEELRRVSHELRPAILDDLGGVAAVISDVREFQRRSGIATFVDVGPGAADERLLPEAEVALLRICQEALHNIERHAHASRVTVRLDLPTAREFRMRVDDDGAGTQPPRDRAALEGDGHLGLIGMEERARIAGGTLSLQRLADSGTRVELRLPRVHHGHGSGSD